MPVRVEEDGSVRETEWGGHYWWRELETKIAELEQKADRFPSREKTRELANLHLRRAEMEALRKAWMRSVVEGDRSSLSLVLLQMDELSHAGLSFDCLLPEDFSYIHMKYPKFVPGPRGLGIDQQAAVVVPLRLEQDSGA